MRKIAFAALLFAFPAAALVDVTLEPIAGYERVQKLVPNPHSRDRLVYGARLTAGVILFTGEAEYLRGSDTESFPTDDLTVLDAYEKARLGVRSGLKLGRLAAIFIRGGAQASRGREERTQAGVTITVDSPLRYDPYAGAGLRIGLSRRISLSAEVTAVLKNFPRMDDNEYLVTAGFAVHL